MRLITSLAKSIELVAATIVVVVTVVVASPTAVAVAATRGCRQRADFSLRT